MRILRKISVLILFVNIFILSVCAQNSQKIKPKETTSLDELEPFTPYIGHWSSYTRESVHASYLTVSAVNFTDGIWEKLENNDGRITYSTIFKDVVTKNWTHTIVGPSTFGYQLSGTRILHGSSHFSYFYFVGKNLFKSKLVWDRITIHLVNPDTIIRSYEISHNEGKTWNMEFSHIFKKIKS